MASDQSWQSQTFVFCAEVVDTTNEVHSRLQGLALSSKRSRASGQTVNTTAKGSVNSLNESSVDVAFALCLFDHLGDCVLCSLIELPAYTNHAMAFILLDHLRDQNIGHSTSRHRPISWRGSFSGKTSLMTVG